jgi:hypothetical protein
MDTVPPLQLERLGTVPFSHVPENVPEVPVVASDVTRPPPLLSLPGEQSPAGGAGAPPSDEGEYMVDSFSTESNDVEDGDGVSEGDISLLSASTGSTDKAFKFAKEKLAQLRQEALKARQVAFEIPPGEEVNVSYPAESGVVSLFAGSGIPGFQNGPVATARFNRPQGVAITPWTPRTIRYGVCGVVYIADTMNHVIRKVDRAGLVTTLAGDGFPGLVDGAASKSRFNEPCGITVNSEGDIFVTDRCNHCVRKIEMKTLQVSTFVGCGKPG